MPDDWVVYELIEGVARQLFRATERDCCAYVATYPRGSRGGSTHIAYRPIRLVKKQKRKHRG